MTCSVIIPCFNYAHFLPTAVDSVLHQNEYVQEIVIVNDGSTDDSLQIAQRYADQYPQIRVLDITNRDMPNALNAGLIALKPVDRVALLDADNWLEANYTHEMGKHDADAVVAALMRHSDDAATGPTLPEIMNPSARELWENCWTHFCPIFKYQALVEVGGFHGLMSGDCDWDIWIDFALRGFTVAYCDTTHYNYRDHDASYTQTVAQTYRSGHRREMWRHHRLQHRDGFEYPTKQYPSPIDLENQETDRVVAHLERYLWSPQTVSS